MQKEHTLEDRELQPAEAFLYALDQTVTTTADLLRKAGCEEECIWSALRESLALIRQTAAEIDVTTQPVLSPPTHASRIRTPQPPRRKTRTLETAS